MSKVNKVLAAVRRFNRTPHDKVNAWEVGVEGGMPRFFGTAAKARGLADTMRKVGIKAWVRKHRVNLGTGEKK